MQINLFSALRYHLRNVTPHINLHPKKEFHGPFTLNPWAELRVRTHMMLPRNLIRQFLYTEFFDTSRFCAINKPACYPHNFSTIEGLARMRTAVKDRKPVTVAENALARKALEAV